MRNNEKSVRTGCDPHITLNKHESGMHQRTTTNQRPTTDHTTPQRLSDTITSNTKAKHVNSAFDCFGMIFVKLLKQSPTTPISAPTEPTTNGYSIRLYACPPESIPSPPPRRTDTPREWKFRGVLEFRGHRRSLSLGQ